MPNHIHSLEVAETEKDLVGMHRDLESQYAYGYNERHGLGGQLFQYKFGFAPKRIGKSIRACIIYIANNASVGKLSDSPTDYRWNLLAYHDNGHPYSEKVRLRYASASLRRAVKKVDGFRRKNQPLTYAALDNIFVGLSTLESRQITDYIIFRYNFLDYEAMTRCFEGNHISDVLLAARTMSGSEHDLDDDWDDYSVYREMPQILRQKGFDIEMADFISDSSLKSEALDLLRHYGRFNERQIRKFLHIAVEAK